MKNGIAGKGRGKSSKLRARAKQLANIREELKQNPCLGENFGKFFFSASPHFVEREEDLNSGVVSTQADRNNPGRNLSIYLKNNRSNDNDDFFHEVLVKKSHKESYFRKIKKGKKKEDATQ